MTWDRFEFGDSRFTHVVPVNDLREHVLRLDCWCHPKQDEEETSVVVHNAMDRREEYEQGRSMS